MANTKMVSEAEVIAFAMDAAERVYDVENLKARIRRGTDAVPTLEQVQAISNLGIAMHDLAGLLLHLNLTNKRLVDLERRLEADRQMLPRSHPTESV